MSEPEHRERKTRSGPSSGSFRVARVEVQELAALAGPEVFSSPGADLLSDELLVDRLLGGELAHYEVLMRRTAARLYRIARGISGHPDRARDIVERSFLRAFENVASYDRRLRFGDWLSRITLHGALAHLKREPSPVQVEPRRQQLDLVRQLEDAVDALPEAFRIPFTLCALDEMFPKDVAETLGVSVEAVRVAGYRGRLRVRRVLGMRYDDAEARAFGLDLASADEIIRNVRARLGLARA
ncbi:MAG TPA: sigma factor-like helix-turn-helix DNA-binding protein [Polyangiaceae bacterium]|nr:sigma factor-like helix-turn-helix DNA-binding protein [Polyangiaceae bacterium]